LRQEKFYNEWPSFLHAWHCESKAERLIIYPIGIQNLKDAKVSEFVDRISNNRNKTHFVLFFC